jgi:hypothetical protein
MPEDEVELEHQPNEEAAMRKFLKQTGPNWWSVATPFGTVGAETPEKALRLARQARKKNR